MRFSHQPTADQTPSPTIHGISSSAQAGRRPGNNRFPLVGLVSTHPVVVVERMFLFECLVVRSVGWNKAVLRCWQQQSSTALKPCHSKGRRGAERQKWHGILRTKVSKAALPEKITHLIIIHLLSCDQKDHASCLNKSYY